MTGTSKGRGKDWYPDDPATSYALEVLSRKPGRKPLVVSDSVKAACERHMSDLDGGKWIWDPTLGDRFGKFCSVLCKVWDVREGELVPFRLLPWQAFCAYSMLSWRSPERNKFSYEPGSRRFRNAFILTAKGSGKSPFGAALGLYMMTNDKYKRLDGELVKEKKQQCFVVASTIEQANAVGLGPAEAMIDNSDQLRDDMGLRRIQASDRIVSTVRGSYLRAIGAQGTRGGLAGLNPHYIQWEEMHEQADRDIVDKLLYGFKDRPQPLCLMLTNAGLSRQSIAYDEYEQAKEAAEGGRNLDSYFAYIAECTEDDIPENGWFPSEKHWEKANPSLGFTIRKDIIKEVVGRAKTERAKNEALQLYASIWSEGSGEFVSQEQWAAVEVEKIEESKLDGARMFVGIDAASRDDMCAVAYLWWCADGMWRLRVRHYSPADGFEDRSRTCVGPLLDWRKDGWIIVPGGGTIDLKLIARHVKEAIAGRNCRHVVSDSYRVHDLRMAFREEDLPFWINGKPEESTSYESAEGMNVEMILHSQTYMKASRTDSRDLWMNGSIESFKGMILGVGDGGPNIEIEYNPVLRWNRGSAVVAYDTQLNKRFDKKAVRGQKGGKIDGLVAATMAAGLGALEVAKGEFVSSFEDPNFSWD